VAIDTGKLIKDLRFRAHGPRAERRALRLAQRWSAMEALARAGLRTGGAVARLTGDGGVRALTRAARRLTGEEVLPEWNQALPRAAPRRLPPTSRQGAAAVYLPACVNRMLGPSRHDPGRRWLPAALVDASARAGLPLWIPPDAPGICCATPWSSKGFRAGHSYMARRLAESAWRWTDSGALPLLIDATSCAHGVAQDVPEAVDGPLRERLAGMEVVDAVAWAHDRLLPRLEVRRRISSAALHPTCSARHLGLVAPLESLARALAEEVVVPGGATCCGMAGDRGLLHPELVEAATGEEAAEVRARPFAAHLSANRTCEVALERSTGRPYISVVQLLEEVTRPPA
jgi:D-lactate dehydrogenase